MAPRSVPNLANRPASPTPQRPVSKPRRGTVDIIAGVTLGLLLAAGVIGLSYFRGDLREAEKSAASPAESPASALTPPVDVPSPTLATPPPTPPVDVPSPTTAAPKWTYKTKVDEMTGKSSRVASVESENVHEFAFPYQGGTQAALGIVETNNGDVVAAMINNGQISCTLMGCQIRVRFDDKPAKEFTAKMPHDLSHDTLSFANSALFLTELKKAKTVKVEFPVFQEGSRIFEFRVFGLNWE